MKSNVCAGGFLIKKNKLLFGKRSKKKLWAPGVWDIVGGHSLKHEDAYETLKRETLEEINIVVNKADLIKVMDVFDESDNSYFKYCIYVITDWSGKPVNCSKEHTKIRWFTKKELENIPLALPEYLPLIDGLINDYKNV